MLGLLTRLLSGALSPLTNQVSDLAARLLRKLALFLAAAMCLVVVLIALTVAFDLWVAARFGAIAGALAVAAVYAVVAAVAVFAGIRKPRAPGVSRAEAEMQTEAAKDQAALDDEIDAFTAPLLTWLQRFGLRREQLAVLAGASVAKQLGPLPLVGLAILAGFLVGRLATSWRSLVPSGFVDDLLASGLFGYAAAAPEEREDEAA